METCRTLRDYSEYVHRLRKNVEKRADTAEKRAESAEAELRKLKEQLNGKNE